MLQFLFYWVGRFIGWTETFYGYFTTVPHRMYYLGGQVVEPRDTHVPDGKVFVEEWCRGVDKKARLLYEGDEITPYEGDPWEYAEMPWLWIGDESRGIDLTQSLARYVLKGNFILHDLLTHYVDHIDDVTYLDTRSLAFLKFPVEGIRV
jgi:hypothetical protein